MTGNLPNNVFLLTRVLGIFGGLDCVILDFLLHGIVFGGRMVALNGELRRDDFKRADNCRTSHLNANVNAELNGRKAVDAE